MIFSISDYKDCLLFDDSFKTLKHLTPMKDEQGDFIFSSGRNSVVFKMLDSQNNSHKALKCFINVNEEQLANIKVVSDYMQYIRSPYLVPYQFYEEEIWLASSYEEPRYYPVLVMDWVEGTAMGSYLKTLCDEDDFKKIKDLALSFDQMSHWLLQQEFAHGDLKLDNLIVNPNGMPIMIDYDGCFIPGMENQLAPELGTPGYQHPLRDEHFFNRHLDHISILVISSALHAMVQKSDLWYEYDNGENLLFSPTDLSNIAESKLWKDLFKLENELANNRLALLQMGLPNLQPITGITEAMRVGQKEILFYTKFFSSIKREDETEVLGTVICKKDRNMLGLKFNYKGIITESSFQFTTDNSIESQSLYNSIELYKDQFNVLVSLLNLTP